MTFKIRDKEMPKTEKSKRESAAQKEAVQKYKDAYRDTFGQVPKVPFDGMWWYTPSGQGVSMKRLKELTRMLKARASML